MTVKTFAQRFDWVLFGSAMAIVGLSFLTFYRLNDNAGQFLSRQIILFPIAIGVMFLVASFDYRVFKNYSSASILLYVTALALLGFALASREIRGVNAWIVLNKFTFQPAEFAKLATVILLAKYFSQKHAEIKNLSHIIVSGLYVALPFFMVFIQPDFGSALVFAAIWLAVLFFSGIGKKHLAGIAILAVVVMAAGWFLVLEDYQKDRVLSFADPYSDPSGQGYHLIQAKIAIGSGGAFGNIWNDDLSYSLLVPEPYTDFAFTSFAHKFGFAGVVLLVGLFVLLMSRIINVASTGARNNFARFFSVGFLGFILAHIAVNIGMNLGFLPITGIPLPFLSYGGSHLITMMAGIGLVQSIRLHG